MDEYIPMMTDEERAARHAARAKARKKKLQQQRIRRLKQTLPIFTVVFLLMGVLSAWATSYAAGKTEVQEEAPGQSAAVLTAMAREPATEPAAPVFTAARSDDTVTLGEDLPSKHAIVIDVEEGKILAEKDAHSVLSPASMTKILTLLVASEHLTEADLDKTVTITREITDYCYVNDCSVVGLMVDEVVPVRELLYGTILSSGADAALGLANFVAGSHEAFVGMMNEKLEELGLSDTAHFTNCVGLYHEDHHCSVYDMAVILQAAMEIPSAGRFWTPAFIRPAPPPITPRDRTSPTGSCAASRIRTPAASRSSVQKPVMSTRPATVPQAAERPLTASSISASPPTPRAPGAPSTTTWSSISAFAASDSGPKLHRFSLFSQL